MLIEADLSWLVRFFCNIEYSIAGRNIHIQRLIKIAVIKRPVPSDRNLESAHHIFECRRIERCVQLIHIAIEIITADQKASESADRVVGYAEKILDLLASEVPGLLKNEDFFTSTLYKETP